MGWLIGVDEAGYGPNLGPLVIAATAWRSDYPERLADLYSSLSEAVCREPGDERIAIADSKQLYKPGGGLRNLERGVGACVPSIDSWKRLIDYLRADTAARRLELPWHASFDPQLPIDADISELDSDHIRLLATCRHAAVEPPRIRARLVFPAEFNELIDRRGGKGAALSHTTLALLRGLIDYAQEDPDPGPICCVLDKHGGRNRYAELLESHFPKQPIETLQESRAVSRYAWGAGEKRIEAAFRSGGEQSLPTALASMTAKLLRELSMRAFNEFWTAKLPGLKPTAGYPVDAKRFKADIAAKQQELGIEDRLLWRSR